MSLKHNESLTVEGLLSRKRTRDGSIPPPSFQSFLQYKAKAEVLSPAKGYIPFFRVLMPVMSACAVVAVFITLALRPQYRAVPQPGGFSQVPIRSHNGTIAVSTDDTRTVIANGRIGVLSLGKRTALAIIPASGSSGERFTLKNGACAFAVLPQQKPVTVTLHLGVLPVTVSVVGTRFLVEQNAASVGISLDSGKVLVSCLSNSIVLSSGERVVIDESNYRVIFGDVSLQKKGQYISAAVPVADYFTPNMESLPEMPSTRGPRIEHTVIDGGVWAVTLAREPSTVTALSADTAALVYSDGTFETITRSERRTLVLPAPVSSRPCVFGRGMPYIAVNANDDTTHIIDTKAMRIAGSLPTGTLRNSSIRRSGDTFCAVNSDGYLVIFSLYRIVHRERIIDMNFSDIAVHGGSLYAVSPSGVLVRYDIPRRVVEWRRELTGRFIEARLYADAAGVTIMAESTFRFDGNGAACTAAARYPQQEYTADGAFFVRGGKLHHDAADRSDTKQE
ncbi:MAG: hypothetical protein AABZ39_01365 [Spirochaetota bacterium]